MNLRVVRNCAVIRGLVDDFSLKISSNNSEDMHQSVPTVSDVVTRVKSPYYYQRYKDPNFAFDQHCNAYLRVYCTSRAAPSSWFLRLLPERR